MNNVLRLQTLAQTAHAQADVPDSDGSHSCSTASWFNCGNCTGKTELG
jgi:hypothetical protein